ncbi:MAG TPA: hypothetical protein VHW92_13155 [Mycobacteriales bacterium]|nr:hypothetical protein [Mycobacteriales bacterium]
MTEPQPLEPGTHAIHIGFRKCATTALQVALRTARPELRAAGAVYPGTGGNQTPAALAITGRTHGWASLGAKPQPMAKWDTLVSRVASIGADKRVIVSSEFFDVADADTIRTITTELGGDRTHIVATLRPLSKILPSAWQQQVQFGSRLSYGAWLRAVLEGNDAIKTYKNFWERHDHAAVLARWASVVGPERVTLIVLDEEDRDRPYRSFESLLGVPHGTLKEVPNRANRSMTGAEAELIRRINLEIFNHDISWDEYSSWVRLGAAQRIVTGRTPGPDEPRAYTPRWALERAAQISAGYVERIAELGLNLVGDLASLAPAVPVTDEPGAEEDPTSVPMAVAVEAILGTAFSARDQSPPPAEPAAAPDLSVVADRELARLLGDRLQQRLRHRWKRWQRARAQSTTSR